MYRQNPHFPVNNGQLCVKGWTAATLLDHPQRVTTPQLRDGRGEWREASWEEAFDFIAAKMRAIASTHPGSTLTSSSV